MFEQSNLVQVDADLTRIKDMFSYMRPAGSIYEDIFVERFLTPLGFTRDKHKNLVLSIGDAPTILWSSHMDTVHHKGGRQSLKYDGRTLKLSGEAKRRGSNCLGGDDTAGIWLMSEMIKAGVPGLYIIHHAEENGCVGSRALSLDHDGLLDDIQAAIAFDRRGQNSVITHQMGARTASDAFAFSLGGLLGKQFVPDDSGSYTDTNEYSGIIPECTNVSVGYLNQHTSRETQDVPFLIQLRDALITADLDALVIERKPSQNDYHRQFDGHWGREPQGLEEYVRSYPGLAAQILEHLGVDEAQFERAVEEVYGR